MHSRIFQLRETPIEEDNYIRESKYYDDWFTREIADYVDGDTDRIEDIEWLKSSVSGIEFGADEHGEYLIIKNREQYFEKSFQMFRRYLEEIHRQNTLKDFTNGISGMWSLDDVYDNKFGFYVDFTIDTDRYTDLVTFDNFIRTSTDGDKYYIGATIDYHF